MHERLGRIGFMAVLALACCLGVFALAGCGGESDEDQIKAGINSMLDSWTGESGIEELAAGEDVQAAATALGVDAAEFAKGMLSHNSFTIKDVTVNGEKATAVVEFMSLDFEALGTTLEEKTDELTASIDPATADFDEVMKQYGQIVMDTINDPSAPTTVSEQTIDYAKEGGKWVMQDQEAVQDELIASATGGM